MAMPKPREDDAADAGLEQAVAEVVTSMRRFKKRKPRDLKEQVALFEVLQLGNDIEMLQRKILAIAAMQDAQGKLPDVAFLRRELATKLETFRAISAKFLLEYGPHTRWWQFWN